MPELPEVQSFVNALNESYSGRRVRAIVLRRGDIRFPLERAELERIFAPGIRLARFRREGKQMVIETEAGAVNVSLGMSGAFAPSDLHAPQLHEHITVVFEDGTCLGFIDPRRFGFWKVRRADGPDRAGTLAPEGGEGATSVDPLDSEALCAVLESPRVSRSRRAIKDALMDQALIGGVGNIYALEALHRARVHPARACASLSHGEKRGIARALPPLLERAIREGGSSVSTYRTLHGASGNFQSLHQVYDREGELCPRPRCGGVIARITQGGRGSWFCPRCQRDGGGGLAGRTGPTAAARGRRTARAPTTKQGNNER